MIEISIVIPSYKEAENLEFLLPHIIEILEKNGKLSEILIVDTMEKMDNTAEVCEKYSSDRINIRYINRRKGNNYGDAIRTGINDADGNYIVVMDGDGSHDPADILRLYEKITETGAGVVIGSRYMKGGKTDNPRILIWMSDILNVCYRILFSLNVKDVSDSYRIYDSLKLKSLELKCDNFDIVEEILIKMKKAFPDTLITEIPITFNKRVYGESKSDLIKFIFSYLKTIKRLKQLEKSE